MSRTAGKLALIAGAAAIAAMASGASAQTSATDPTVTAEARLAWAKRHVELVCRPLEARQMFDKATRCYNDVARIVGETSKTLPTAQAKPAVPATRPAAAPPVAPALRPAVRTASKPAPASRVRVASRPVAAPVYRPAVAEPAVSASRRCSGVACLQYTLLGVGF